MPLDLDALDRAAVVVLMIEQRAHYHPSRLPDLGNEWLKDIHPFDSREGIAEFQVLLCERWGSQDIFRPLIIEQIRSLTTGLFWYHLNEDIAEHTEARERDKRWSVAGDVLDAVGQVRVSPDDDSEAAVLEVTEVVSYALCGLAESDRRSAVRIAFGSSASFPHRAV